MCGIIYRTYKNKTTKERIMFCKTMVMYVLIYGVNLGVCKKDCKPNSKFRNDFSEKTMGCKKETVRAMSYRFLYKWYNSEIPYEMVAVSGQYGVWMAS